jgi:hypothetical protein
MRPIDHVRALIADIMTSPAYKGGEVRDCIEPYLPLERCNDHQLRAVWLKLDALKGRAANRGDREAYLRSFNGLNGFDEPCIYNNFGAD